MPVRYDKLWIIITSVRVTVNMAVSNEFYSWIFGFWGKVKIKAPQIIKEHYA